MAKQNTRTIRTNSKFAKEIEDMQLKRILKGKDLKTMKTSRITLAMTRHKFFPIIKQDIIEANLK